MNEGEEIVMTPSKFENTTSIRCEKINKRNLDESQIQLKAGGKHQGIVINKSANAGENQNLNSDLQLEFKCFLVDNKTGKHIPESRVLKFWFRESTDYLDKVTAAYEFFKILVKPDSFPRLYVGFIKKVMKLMQESRFYVINITVCELTPLDIVEEPETENTQDHHHMNSIENEDLRPTAVIVQERLLMTLESAYPNIMPVDYLSDLTNYERSLVDESLELLRARDLIKELEPGKWVRKVKDDETEVKVVKQNLHIQIEGKKPTIAIITSKYNEKLAVDAMMSNKTTFVKWKTEGESNVYTIGFIGQHKVVSTKLPAIGIGMREQIAAGSTTTRLLGTFGTVEHVLLVGVAGGVPHYADYYKDVRLGDVILSDLNSDGRMYLYCDKLTKTNTSEKGSTLQYKLKSWQPTNDIIQQVQKVVQQESNVCKPDWIQYIEDGQNSLIGQEVSFSRPQANTDRLYMNIGGNDMIEVAHPKRPDSDDAVLMSARTTLRLGSIASGKPIVSDEHLRGEFAAQHQCLSYDAEFDQVLESIVGNRKESFTLVRGVSDYIDGTTKSVTWQPYAALAAAAVMKAIIERLPEIAE